MRDLFAITTVLIALFFGVPTGLAAQPDAAQLRREVEQLRKQLEALEAKLEALETQPAGEVVAEETAKEPLGLASYMDVYGSLRVRTGIDSVGLTEIDDNASRIGITGELPFANDRYAAFARFEVGIRMVSSPNQLDFIADPGGGVGQDDDTITSRLGLGGIRTPFGTFSWGKQESTYYDIAGWTTDQSFVFGGEASGAYHNGTDGGPSGTGRADKSAQYRVGFGPVALGLQSQNRNTPDNPNSRDYGDTLGGSLRYSAQNGLSVGVAYQEVRDGIEEPEQAFPAIGDQATIFGLRYQNEKLYLGGVYSVTEQHETDDQGNFYDGSGVELFGSYLVRERVKLEGGWVYTTPDSGQAGEYQLSYGYAGIGYLFGDHRKGAAWLEFRIDDSSANDGSDLRNHLLAGGVTFDF